MTIIGNVREKSLMTFDIEFISGHFIVEARYSHGDHYITILGNVMTFDLREVI